MKANFCCLFSHSLSISKFRLIPGMSVQSFVFLLASFVFFLYCFPSLSINEYLIWFICFFLWIQKLHKSYFSICLEVWNIHVQDSKYSFKHATMLHKHTFHGVSTLLSSNLHNVYFSFLPRPSVSSTLLLLVLVRLIIEINQEQENINFYYTFISFPVLFFSLLCRSRFLTYTILLSREELL